MNNLGLVLIVIVLLGWVAYYYEKLQDQREVLQLRRVKDTLLITLIPILREERIVSTEELGVAYEQLMAQKERHLGMPIDRQNKWYLELVENKLQDLRDELSLRLRR